MESNDLFDSSDSVRSGKALAHVKTAVFPGPIKLSTGRFLPELKIAYETYGELDPQKTNPKEIGLYMAGAKREEVPSYAGN